MLPAVLGELDDPVLGVSTGGETGYAHLLSLSAAAELTGQVRMAAMSPTAAAFDAVEVIRTKRDGAELSDAQIDWVIAALHRR